MMVQQKAEEPEVKTLSKSVQKPPQYSGKKTYKTKGPITVNLGTTTAGYDGLSYSLKWSPLDQNGKRGQTIKLPGNKGVEDANTSFFGVSKTKNYTPTIGNPYGPYGWEVEISIPPQPAYNANAGMSWLDVTVSE